MKINILQVPSGDDKGIPIICKNPANNQPIDISGFNEIVFTARDKKMRIVIEKKLSLGGIEFDTDGTDGLAILQFQKQDTHNLKSVYAYDLEFTDAVTNKKETVVDSFIVVKEDKTQ